MQSTRKLIRLCAPDTLGVSFSMLTLINGRNDISYLENKNALIILDMLASG